MGVSPQRRTIYSSRGIRGLRGFREKVGLTRAGAGHFSGRGRAFSGCGGADLRQFLGTFLMVFGCRAAGGVSAPENKWGALGVLGRVEGPTLTNRRLGWAPSMLFLFLSVSWAVRRKIWSILPFKGK